MFFLSSRNQLKKMNNELSPLLRKPGLDLELDYLQDLLDRLALEYKAKSNSADNTLGPNDRGQLHQLKQVKLRNSFPRWTVLDYMGNPSKNNLFCVYFILNNDSLSPRPASVIL